MYAGATLEIYHQDPFKLPIPPLALLATFNVREMMSQGVDAFQVMLDNVAMRPVLEHPVFAANIKRSKSKNYPDGKAGIFPGTYMRFAKRGSAWELDNNHDVFVRLGFSIKVGEVRKEAGNDLGKIADFSFNIYCYFAGNEKAT
jgi:hypothetical protein